MILGQRMLCLIHIPANTLPSVDAEHISEQVSVACCNPNSDLPSLYWIRPPQVRPLLAP